MLVLHRKADEKIFIGDGANQIVVTVIKIDRGKVVLGFDAPRHIPIARDNMVRPKPVRAEQTYPPTNALPSQKPLTLYDVAEEDDDDLDLEL